MPNGKLGDHSLTDLLVHGQNVFVDEIDQLTREIAEQDKSYSRQSWTKFYFHPIGLSLKII